MALHSVCFGRPLRSKEIGKSPLLVDIIITEGDDIFYCLKSMNGLSDSVVTRHPILTVSFSNSLSLKRVNYNTIYALLFSLILSVSSKKNKFYTVKNLNK